MGKDVAKPKEELAPAYFVQYSALWCILLGFFVMLLSLGNTQMGPGDQGVGEVRDAFGSTGGLGLLPYAKNALFGRNDGSASSFRIRKSAPSQVAEVDGYIRGMLWRKGIADVSLIKIVRSSKTSAVIISVPVDFRGNDGMEPHSVELLELLGEVLTSLTQYQIAVGAVCEEEGGNHRGRQRSSLMRAAVVARLLTESASMSGERVRAVGFSDSSVLESYGMDHVKDHVIIFIQKVNE